MCLYVEVQIAHKVTNYISIMQKKCDFRVTQALVTPLSRHFLAYIVGFVLLCIDKTNDQKNILITTHI